MIKLFSFGSKFGVADPSPFVLKVDAYMRMAGIKFENIAKQNNIQKAPKGKLPFIEDEGVVIPDSQAIIKHLKQVPEQDLDKDLTDEQKAISYLVTKSLDEDLYFILVYSRWFREDTWPLLNKTFFGGLPFLLRLFVPKMVRKQVLRNLHGQGVSRHSDEEIRQLLRSSLQALTDLLGAKQYFFGENPTSLDATCFGMLAECILVDIDNPYNQIAREYTSLVDYCERIKQKYYSE